LDGLAAITQNKKSEEDDGDETEVSYESSVVQQETPRLKEVVKTANSKPRLEKGDETLAKSVTIEQREKALESLRKVSVVNRSLQQ